MKKKNPYIWNFRDVPEQLFKIRPMSPYRRDKTLDKIIQRGQIKGRVHQYERSGELSNWLPSVKLYVTSVENIIKNLYDIKDASKLRDLYKKIEKSGGLQFDFLNFLVENRAKLFKKLSLDPNRDIIFVATISEDMQKEQLTPFNLVHELGEEIVSNAELNIYDNVGDLLSRSLLLADNYIYPNTIENYKLDRMGDEVFPPQEIFLFIPKLVHVQSNRNGRPTETFIDYVFDIRDNPVKNNYLSDLWALWCKNEKLFPNQFYNVDKIIDLIPSIDKDITELAHRENRRKMKDLDTIEQFCTNMNTIFMIWLEFLKGCIVSEDIFNEEIWIQKR